MIDQFYHVAQIPWLNCYLTSLPKIGRGRGGRRTHQKSPKWRHIARLTFSVANRFISRPIGDFRDLLVTLGYYHLRRLRQVRRHVTRDTLKQLVCSLIRSRLDYCNSILIGLPASSIAPLHRLQNAAARLVMGLRARDHITSALFHLHWLPVFFRIQYKVSLTMFLVHTHQCPVYLSNIVTPLRSNPSRHRLRSSAGTDNLSPRKKTKCGERSFSVTGPTTWNSSPETVRRVTEATSFKRLLETYLFNIAF
jgi:hypothetical protein